eukprot:303504-Rhodomonas_salina.4
MMWAAGAGGEAPGHGGDVPAPWGAGVPDGRLHGLADEAGAGAGAARGGLRAQPPARRLHPRRDGQHLHAHQEAGTGLWLRRGGPRHHPQVLSGAPLTPPTCQAGPACSELPQTVMIKMQFPAARD